MRPLSDRYNPDYATGSRWVKVPLVAIGIAVICGGLVALFHTLNILFS